MANAEEAYTAYEGDETPQPLGDVDKAGDDGEEEAAEDATTEEAVEEAEEEAAEE